MKGNVFVFNDFFLMIMCHLIHFFPKKNMHIRYMSFPRLHTNCVLVSFLFYVNSLNETSIPSAGKAILVFYFL